MFSRRDLLVSVAALGGAAVAPSRLLAASTGRVFEIPIQLESGRLVVSCMIDGQGPFDFGIDTGAFLSMIQQDLAERLKLNQHGSTPAQIAGRSTIYPVYEARELIFGNLLKQNRVLLAAVDRLPFGPNVVGMLAAGCLTTMDSELDFRARQWRIYPEGGPPRVGWTRHEHAIVLTGGVGSSHLFGRMTLGGRQFRCLLDTGAPGPVLLFQETARKGGIDLVGQNWSPSSTNGRKVRIYRSRLPLTIGDLVLERQLVRVQESGPGFIDDGLIGLPLIERLDIATEVKPGLLWTRPNGVAPEPERYNLSGLWIDRRGDQLFAGEVGKGSPAEQAGILRGDRIEGLAFEPLIASLNGPAGATTSFEVIRGSQRRDITLELRNYL